MKMKYLLLVFPYLLLSQTPQIEYYKSGEVFREYYVKNKTLDSTFVQYYKNGNMQTQTRYKKCEYETNYTKMYRSICGVGRYFNEEKKISNGKKHGKQTFFYKDGQIEYTQNYHCGIEQGNFINYRTNGTIEYSEFYHEGNLITEREYHENGALKLFIQYTHQNMYSENPRMVSYVQTEFRADSTIKNTKEVSDYNGDNEKGTYKEYYPNGFLKIEEELVEDFREGIYREFYDTGNMKYAGEYINEKRVRKHYYFDRSGKVLKIESWEADKLISTEYKNKS